MRALTLYRSLLTPTHRALFLDVPDSSSAGVESHWCAIVVTLGLTYLLRLPSKERADYTANIDAMLRGHDAPEHIFLRPILDACLAKLYWRTAIPHGIAPTLALQENIYAAVVCLSAGIPLNLTGPPGCGKSLAIQVRRRQLCV